MTESRSMADIQQHLSNRLLQHDPEVEVRLRRNSLGWVRLRVVTDCFADSFPEREALIDDILEPLGLSLASYPFYDYELLTAEEAAEGEPYQPTRLPLWSEILMAPSPEQPIDKASLDEIPKHTLVVTFYSFKGGVGRTTALQMVAGMLARSRRVVMIDLDLEAPGLSAIFPAPDEAQFGVLDYLYQRSLTPELNVPPIEDCIRQIELQTRGELYLVSAGDYNEGYIHRLADLDVAAFYRNENNPIHQLLADLKSRLEPDVILIDARTGFDPTSAVALFDLADLAVICFSPTEQSFSGLEWVVQAARKQYDYNGKPDLHFLLTPIPPASAEQQQRWTTKAEEWIENKWGTESSVMTSETYNLVLYNPQIPVLSSFLNDVPSGVLAAYKPLFEVIDNNLPDTEHLGTPPISQVRQPILSELKFQSATAQDIESQELPTIFQRTGDFPQFLREGTWLIRGAKGTGKTLLFRLFIEQAQKAKELARLYTDLSHTDFVIGHGAKADGAPTLTSSALRSYHQQTGQRAWSSFWLNYALLQLCYKLPELRKNSSLDAALITLAAQDHPSQHQLVTWLVERATSPLAEVQAIDELQAIDKWLEKHNQRIWLFYDELDASFGTTPQEHAIRKEALEALLAWWLERTRDLSCIMPKMLLREDIWNAINFTNKGHYTGHTLQLRWDEEDLWRMVLRQALSSSPTLAKLLKQQLNIVLTHLDRSDLNQLRESLYPLWGERMGRGQKAYTYNWVRKRITDTQNDRFPRSLVLLLKEAIVIEGQFARGNVYDTVLRPRALIDALPLVSDQRVDEIRNEYPEFNEELNRLKGERSPLSIERLAEIWGKKGQELKNLILNMIEAGIMQEYQPTKINNTERYAVAELYLYGLGMRRKGQR